MLDFTVALTLRARRDRDEEPGVAVTIGRRRIELRRHHSGGVIVNTCGLVFFRRPPFRSGWPGCRPVRVG